MASVDDRIVKMEFDNASFEKKLGNTLTSLGMLDKALKFTGATKGLSDVSAAAEKVHFGGMAQGIEDVSKKFLALSTVALTVLSNITTQAMHAGIQIAKSFTVAPLIEGFREYETQLNAVQTILANTASKGTTLDQVNDALQRLNEYSDQTIYNFGQMARNIGTFTAAGVDLETSVSSIKGIANLAAMSGSNAEQASTAMYQLSQAIAAGSLKLMDWNSVVNAGMGGEAFKTALFETQKVMGNTLKVPVGQTFKEWEAAGNSFRETLQDGWITADILTTTLSTFTGDMTEEMLLQKGFSEAQAANILKTAAMAKAAATEVKTFTQLIGTVKEAVGTGWADSFKIIIGNFTEAKELWTGVNNAIGGFVQKTSDARNELLSGWKFLGGRTLLIESLKTAFQNLNLIIQPIMEAFRDIFPPLTAERLYELTGAFSRLATALAPTQETVEKIRSIFSGFFSVLSIGWEIIKEGTKFFIGLGKSLLGLTAPGATGFLAKLGDGLTSLQEALVKGGGIKDFFAGLTRVLQKPLEFLGKIRDAIGNIFDLFDESAAERLGEGFGRISDRFSGLKNLFESLGNLWEPFQNAAMRIVNVLDGIWDIISEWFKTLGKKIADVMGEGDFDAVLDAVNTGLLGGIALLLAKFIKTGFSFDIGSGLFEKIGKSFEQLTGVLSAMQANIKANALIKIAAAIAILTASVLVLSMIDSAALTKALTAMAIGFGQLMASFSVFTKLVSTPQAALSFTVLSAGLILLATSMLILSLAVRSLAKLDWEELAKGLIGITVLLGALVLASGPLSANASGMISAGVGITAMAIGLTILAVAMKIFATMSWEEMGKGLIGVAGGLVILAAGVRALPGGPTMIVRGAGLIILAAGLLILASAVAIFGNMEWETMGKGFVGIAGGLLAIAGAMQLMPLNLPVTAAGLVILGFALIEIAGAMKLFSKMSWEEIARGLVGMAGALLILSGALYLMGQNAGGAAALILAAIGLGILGEVVMRFARLSWDDLAHGLGAMAISLAVIAAAAFAMQPAIPIILALGAALIVLGAGFAVIGLAAFLVGKALESIAKSGEEAAKSLPAVLKALGESIPALMTGLAQGLVNMAQVFADAAPVFAESITALIVALLEKLKTIIPLAGEVIRLLVLELFAIIRSYGAEYIKTGLFIITKLLQGLKQNIGPIVHLVGDIFVRFLNAMEDEVPRVAKNVADLIIEIYTEAAYQVGRVAGTLLFGIGMAFMSGLLDGVESSTGPVMTWFKDLAGKVLGWIGDVVSTLLQKGIDFITGLLGGIDSAIGAVFTFFITLPGKIFDWVGNVARNLWDKGTDIIGGFLGGIIEKTNDVLGWIREIPRLIIGAIPNPLGMLWDVGKEIIQGLKNGMEAAWEKVKGWLSNLNPANWFNDINLAKGHAAKNMVPTGLAVMNGLQYGMQENWHEIEDWLSTLDPSKSIDENLATNMSKILTDVSEQISAIDEFNPVITPVLDLTNVLTGATQISKYIRDTNVMVPSVSVGHAQTIATTQQEIEAVPFGNEAPVAPGVNFEQNIYSPTQLSTSDIYKQTRNQITIAKEELSIP